MSLSACKYCNLDFSNLKFYQKGAHVRNCKMNPKHEEMSLKISKSLIKSIERCLVCNKCSKSFKKTMTEETYLSKKIHYCSRSCSNSRGPRSEEVKNKISNSMKELISNGKLKVPGTISWTESSKEKMKITINANKIERYDTIFETWIRNDWSVLNTYSKDPNGIAVLLKKVLIFKLGPNCSICNWSGMNPKSNKPCVQLDHIDGDFTNNSFSNVRLLCPNCHSMTPTYGALNKGNGRKLKGYR